MADMEGAGRPRKPTPATMMAMDSVLLNDLREFMWLDANGNPARCHLRHYQTGLGMVVVFTEVKHNKGMSVTNDAENLVAAACKALGLKESAPIWLEHYGPDAYGDPREADRFARIRVRKDAAPSWEDMPTPLVVEMVGPSVLNREGP